MNISEIIQYSRGFDSFDSIVPLVSLKTKEDVEAAQAKNIDAAFTLDEFKEKFPGVEYEHIYFGNIIGSSAYYWDPETLVVFSLPIIQGEFFSPNGASLIDELKERKMSIEKSLRENNFVHIVYTLNDRMRMEYLRILIDRDVPGIYDTFKTVYPLSDFGCASLGIDGMEKLLSRKSEEQAAETKEQLENLPDVVTIYRGEGSVSASYREAFSWSLGSNYGLFFATRLGEENARLYKGKAKKEDILECFDSEKEVLVMPDKVFDVEEHALLGLAWLTEVLPEVSPLYHDYLDGADYKRIPFEIDSAIHGKVHCMRVLLNMLLISYMRGLSAEDEELLAEAALYHDVGRMSDGEDRAHGAASAKKYKKAHKNADPIVLFLMRYHCRPDEEGYAAIGAIPGLKGQEDRARRLLDIFKDADALDRVRLGRADTDWEQLRTPEGKQLPLVARLILESLKERADI